MQRNDELENKIFEFTNHGDVEGLKRYQKEQQILNTQRTSDGKTPLHVAVEHGDGALIQYLLNEKGVSQNLLDKEQKTPLYYAHSNNNDEIIKILHQHKNSPCENNYQTTLVSLIKSGNLSGLKKLLSFIPINQLKIWEETGKISLLEEAIKINDKYIISCLLEIEIYQSAIILNKRSNGVGDTPLHASIKLNRPEIFILLIQQKNIDVSVRDTNGNNILFLTVMFGDVNLLQNILENPEIINKISINHQNDSGDTILHVVNDLDKFTLLLKQDGIAINRPNKKFVTPLELFISANRYPFAELLVKMGADCSGIPTQGLDPKMVALLNKYKDKTMHVFAIIPSVNKSTRPFIASDIWYASLIRKPKSETLPLHVSLIIEGKNNETGKYIIRKYDCYHDRNKQGFVYIQINSNESVMVYQRKAVMKQMLDEAITDKETIYYKSYPITQLDGEKIHEDVLNDKKKQIRYFEGGDANLSKHSSEKCNGHNCFTWAREKLKNNVKGMQNIIESELTSVFDYAVAFPTIISPQGSGFFQRCQNNMDVAGLGLGVGIVIAAAGISLMNNRK